MSQAESDHDAVLELLRFAAKAIGFDLHINQAGASQLWKNGAYVRFWNPLAYDDDAFRLAVATHLHLQIDDAELGEVFAFCEVPSEISELTGDDPCAATRLVIVRAAAKIGESTP